MLMAAGRTPDGLWQPAGVLASLAEKYPRTAGGGAGASSGASAGGFAAACAANAALADAVEALAAAHSDDQFKRNTFTALGKVIRVWPDVITKGATLAAGPRKVPGVGKGSASVIDEFIANGRIEVRKG